MEINYKGTARLSKGNELPSPQIHSTPYTALNENTAHTLDIFLSNFYPFQNGLIYFLNTKDELFSKLHAFIYIPNQ